MFTTAQPRAVRTLTPALLTAIAYVDPGNFGVNMTAGAGYGYALVWVVVAASVAAALIQYLAAKLGVATGKSLALLSAERSSPVLRWIGWLQAELVVIMTDLAELVGGAIALHLLFGLPLQVGAVIVAAFSFLVLGLRVRGIRLFEVVVLTLLGVIVVAMAVQLIFLGTHPTTELAGRVGQPVDDGIVLLAVGIVGATVMPHALHFHSAMSAPDGSTSGQPGTPGLVTPRIRRSVVVALSLAGLTNVSIVLVGARLPQAAADGLEPAHGLLAAIGQVAGVAFAWRCWRRAWPRPSSGRSPGRWCCRATCGGRCPSGCVAASGWWSRWSC